jgi:hypothetical protein
LTVNIEDDNDMPKHSARLMELARKGAEARIKELEAEIAELRKAFLHLPFGAAASSAIPARAREIEVAKPRRRRRMSAAARKRISAAQKARWAARRKAKDGGKGVRS